MRRFFSDFRFRRLSIRARLLLMIVAVILPAAGGFAWLIVHEREQAREAAYAQVRVVAHNIASQISTVLSNSETMLERLAARPSVRALDARRCDPIFQEYLLLRRESTVLSLRDAQGRLICSSDSNRNPLPSAQMANIAWFREGIAANRFRASDTYLGLASGRWVTILSHPVRDDAGQVTGLLFMGIDLLKLQERLARNAPQNAHLAAFDRQYKFLMRSIEPEKSIGTPLPEKQLAFIKGRNEANFPARNIVGVAQLWALITMPETGWRVTIGLPEDEVFAPSGADLQRTIAAGIGTLLLMIALSWFISRPIRNLAQTSRRLIAGDAGARAQLDGPAEIEAVAAHFNQLLEERERTLETLRKNEERFQLATRGSSDGFWDWNVVTGEDYFSERFCELLGYGPGGLKPHVSTWHELLHPDDVEAVMRAVQTHLEQRKPYDMEFRMRTKCGEYRWFRGRGQALWNEAGQPLRMAGSLTDITDNKRAEVRLRESEAGLREAQKIAKVGSWELDLVSGSLHWSDEIFRIFEIDQAKFAATYEAFLNAIHPEDRDAVNAAYTGSLQTRVPYQIQHRLLMADGRIKWVHERCQSDFDSQGKPLRSVGTVQDITALHDAEQALRVLNAELEGRVEKRTAELKTTNEELTRSLAQLRQAQTQLVQSEKMAALGGLVAGVAHEINTPVGIGVTAASHLDMKVQGLTERYRSGALSREDMEGFLATANESSEMVLSNLKRAADLIRSFKQVAVDQSGGHRRHFRLKAYLEEVLLSLGPQLNRTRHHVSIECPPELELYSHPGACSQIITNLVMNSLLHGFENVEAGHIAIRVIEQPEGLLLRYTDDGKGIAPENLPHIFDPFYTTKRGTGGSGLGLHVIYNIITQSLGGSVTCESEPGKGVAFEIRIPRAALFLDENAAADALVAAVGG